MYFLEEARAKALSAVQKNKVDHKFLHPKIELQFPNLPKIEKNVQGKIEINEEKISKYMQVLRKTNQEIGKALIDQRRIDRKQEKEAKKSKNEHAVRENLRTAKNCLRLKIRQMRQERAYPLPKSYMNYKKRNGFLGKNTINT